MRIYKIFLSIFILVGFLSSCSDSYDEKDVDRGTNQENLVSTTSVNSVSSIDRIADFSTFFISSISESWNI